MTAGRLVLLSTTTRAAPGLLSWPAWSVLMDGQVLAGSPGHPQTDALRAAGIDVRIEEEAARGGPDALAAHLVAQAREHGLVIWLVGPDGDRELGEALGSLLMATTDGPELELLPGSYDLPGAAVLDLVAVMDRLRSPGGCPWDAQQSHESLVTYLVEETYETLEAIETGDRDHLREELGDLLLQVAFHSRIAEEHPDRPWSIDDVAQDIANKLVRRHPHVFGPERGLTAADVERNWETLKATEKGRESAIDGIPMALPALTLAGKLMSRTEKSGLEVQPPPDPDSIGSRLLALVAEARRAGLDAEAELRAAARSYADRVRAAERGDGT